MKKIILGLLLLTFITGLNAQVIFSENFDATQGPTAGGAGTYTFPTGWLLRNVDNRTPAANVAYINEAWERREDFNFNVIDSAAFSTSWYSPAGPADDWMWTPLITNLPANTVLSWNAVTYDPSYPDGYEVRIMTQVSTPGGPTGGTGVMGNQETNSTQIFTIPAENTTWTTRSVNLNAYTGQSVWIAFRNTSNDKFILLIDDVIVQVPNNYDADITAVTPLSDYSNIPLNQQPILPISATVKNNGAMGITNVVLQASVYDGLNNLIFTSNSPALATLASGVSSVFTTTAPFIPATIDSFRVEYLVSINETDQNLANNTHSDSINITDSVYARDLGTLSGTLGIGSGDVGNLGQQFVLTEMAKISSVSIFLSGQVAGSNIGIDIFNFENGLPTTLLYSSTADSLTTLFTGWLHFPVPGSIVLLPDTYVVAAREIDSTLALGNTVDKFTLGTVWVNWPTSPFSGWANVEDFGGSFSKSFMVRLNLLDKCDGNNLVVTSLQGSSICLGTNDTLIATGGTNYSWDGVPGNDTLIIAPNSDQTYTLTSIDQYLCIDTAIIQINVNDLPLVTANSSAGDTVCAGTGTILTGGGALSYLWTNGVTDGMSFVPTSTLTYTVTGTDTNGCINTASIEIYVDPCVGINSNNPMSEISVFPNPGNGDITVILKENMFITVYNALGEVIIKERFHQGVNHLNLMKFDSGIYYIKATTDNSIQKIIKIIKID
ncbi:MAG: choice-of-anchor J domain-containing protein [Bacteroidales bacterium]|nr:choice-of-anchor J domain-containing protein [Bacteroidales bacterium]